MKTVFITRKYPPARGGMETFSYELTQRWKGDRTVLHNGKRQADILWAIPLLTVRGLFAARSASVVHLGDLVLSPIARVLKLFSAKPIVATVHGLELTYRDMKGLYGWLVRSGLQSIDHFVCVSENTAALLRSHGIAEDRVSVIPHGVEVEPKQKEESRVHVADELGLDSSDLRATWLLTVGRLVRRKGVEWFVREVLSTMDTSEIRYLVASTGPEHDRIQAAIDEHGLQDRVRLVGKVSDALLQDLYSGADIFVMPNIQIQDDVEGFGFVAIEAAAHGLPVLSSNCDGIPAAIHNEQNGILVQAGNVPTYRTQLEAWIASPEEREAFGTQAAQYTVQHFDWDRIVDRYATRFSSLATPSTNDRR